jgi:serine/threonine-protein kinase
MSGASATGCAAAVAEQIDPAVGATFGPYTIERLLGRGGMGTVYLATHTRLDRKVALKLIARELAADADFRARFLRESRLAASLDHPNVVPVYDADEIDGVLYLAMRYVTGPSLQTLLWARGSLSLDETARIAEQIGAALDAAHAAGLVHRDVKPANILLAEAGDYAYLCDFGLAKRADVRDVTRTGFFLGTVDYCAPEQIRGEPVDGGADVYSLGCVVFHCLAGEPPFRRGSELAVADAHLHEPPPVLSSVRAGLPRTVDDALAAAMAKDPARRATATELARRLADDAETRPAPVPRSRRNRRRTIAALIAVAAVSAIGVTAAALLTRGSDSTSDAQLRTFVDRVENMLEQSAGGRREIGAALSAGLTCSITPTDAARRIESVADNRQSLLVQLANLPTPSGDADRAATLLQRALQQSIEADRRYRDGFDAVDGRPCPLPKAPFDAARATDVEATAAKRRFVGAFNPLARRFDRRTWSASGF